MVGVSCGGGATNNENGVRGRQPLSTSSTGHAVLLQVLKSILRLFNSFCVALP